MIRAVYRSAYDDVDAGRHLEELGPASFSAQRKHPASQLEAIKLEFDTVGKPRCDLHAPGGQIWSDP